MPRCRYRASFWALAVTLALCSNAIAQPNESKGAGERTAKPAKPDEKKNANQGEAKSADVVATDERKEGVKTYTFSAVEVEGRLRSPQILYFLRRVRAEFSSAALGHRSFMLELLDTRRDESLR